MNRMSFLVVAIILAVLITASCANSVSTSSSPSIPVATPSPDVTPRVVRTPDVSKYETQDWAVFGLYLLDSKDIPGAKLIISDDNQPIPPKVNNPDEVTIPGFYLSREERMDFERVSVVGKQVSFKTREIDGIYYEFDGTSGDEIIPDFSSDVPVPFIMGTLRKIENGKVLKTEKVKFGHVVIA